MYCVPETSARARERYPLISGVAPDVICTLGNVITIGVAGVVAFQLSSLSSIRVTCGMEIVRVMSYTPSATPAVAPNAPVLPMLAA